MINEEYGKFQLVCDICQNEHEQQYDTWSEAVEGKREAGFRVKREGGGYIDICRNCQEW